MAQRLKKSLRIACLQTNAGSDWEKNLSLIRRRLRRLLRRRLERPLRYPIDCVALPEMFYWRGPSSDLRRVAEASKKVVREFRQLARQTGVAFLLGSLLTASGKKGKFYNTSFLISEKGKIAGRYQKIHLFNIGLKGKITARESRHILPGKKIVTGSVSGIRCGLTVCYDLRFPELFRHLAARGVEIIFVPANFTYFTGQAHWETLLRARAIENQAFIVAPAQIGVHPTTGIRSFGTSLIIDPWGSVLARGSRTQEETVTARLDLAQLRSLRRSFPVLSHRRLR